MASLTLTPNPAAPSSKVTVAGTGFANRSTRIRLAGSVVVGSFLPGADGAFNRTITAPAAGSYTVEVQQKLRGWQVVKTAPLTVAAAVPPPVPNPAPGPEPTPPPAGPVRNFGPGTILGPITASVANETWLLDPGAVLAGLVTVQAPGLTIKGGSVWYLSQYADNLTLDGIRSRRLDVMGASGLHVMGGTDFRDHTETAIRFHLKTGGAPWGPALLEDFAITHTGFPQNGRGYSSISSERPAGDPVNGPKGGAITIRRYRQDQGVYGWGGVEIEDDVPLVISDAWFKGGNDRARGAPDISAHISVPRCSRVAVEYCDFDMRMVGWGVEFVELLNPRFVHNRAHGPSGASLVQLHGGSAGAMSGAVITDNEVSDVSVFVNQYGSGHTISHNRLVNVGTVYKDWGNPGTPPTISDNGPTVVVTAGPR